jgi:long-chain acyl-CoA synthetase
MFTVGDIGYLDAGGYPYLCDRKSDMIISGGVNIYPAEVEVALSGHPAVADAAVFGIPHDDWGEEIKAVVQPAPDAEPGPAPTADLLAYLAGRLARFKLPAPSTTWPNSRATPTASSTSAASVTPTGPPATAP